jgi:DNA-binding FadR family transcriptional regulator
MWETPIMPDSRAAPRTTPVLPALNTAPGYKRVAQLIEAEILEGRIKVGDLLPIEGDLAEQLGVHRSTVREGIRALENAGLVKRAGGKRLMVTIPDSTALTWANTRAMGLQKVSFRELWELQMELEPFCAQLAAERVTDEMKQALRDNIEHLEKHIEDDDAVIAGDMEFHTLVATIANNRALSLALAPIGVLLFSATVKLYQRVPQARHRLLEAHQEIVRAIVGGDAQTARLWMSRHIADFRRGYETGGFDMDAAIELDARALRN